MTFIENYWIYGLGFLGQSLFGARLIVQWFHSEKQGKVVSPTIYWKLSLVAALIVLIYGVFRDDVIIIVGQCLSYYIYIRNLQLKNEWEKSSIYVRTVLFLLPIFVLYSLFFSTAHSFEKIFLGRDFLEPLTMMGVFGQLLLNFRFIYQWYYSEKRKSSILPLGFWIISLCASLLILVYGFYRRDPVLLVSQGMGIFAYIRNILLYSRSHRGTQ